uniref:Cytochrome P450, family 4, subfamily F, polypeptide 3 n=1 Tax=Astatotilapia calliptera TaxID=8154 RepID=A0A3P8NS62_ASTCA
MALLHTVLALVLSWTGLCSVLYIFSTGLVAVVALWTARLLLRHAWYSHRLSCFSKPQTRSWLLDHLGKMQSTEEGLQRLDDLVQTYKHSCCWFLGPFYHLVRLFHPDYVKPLLIKHQHITVKDELISHCLRPWLGHSVLISNGVVWSHKRRLLTPAFHFDILRSYIAVFNSSSKIMHVRYTQSRQVVSNCNLEMFDHITLLTLDSLLKCAFSYDSNCQESSSEYVSAILELSILVTHRRENIFHHWDQIYWKTQQGKRFKQALKTLSYTSYIAFTELRVVVALTLLRFRLIPGVKPELGSSSGRVRRLPQLALRAEGGLWLQLEPLNRVTQKE